MLAVTEGAVRPQLTDVGRIRDVRWCRSEANEVKKVKTLHKPPSPNWEVKGC
jgi:hypothetical protein